MGQLQWPMKLQRTSQVCGLLIDTMYQLADAVTEIHKKKQLFTIRQMLSDLFLNLDPSYSESNMGHFFARGCNNV